MATVRRVRIDFAGQEPASARTEIRSLLATDVTIARKVYAGLAHKVWLLLIERRLDDEVRDWHRLILDVRANIQRKDEKVSERLCVLTDLLAESISLAETSPVQDLARRPHARRILEELHMAGSYVARQKLQQVLAIGTTHLSNVLSKLVAHNLVERRDAGKEAEFRLTARGRDVMGLAPTVPVDALRQVMQQYFLLSTKAAPNLDYQKIDTLVLPLSPTVSSRPGPRRLGWAGDRSREDTSPSYGDRLVFSGHVDVTP